LCTGSRRLGLHASLDLRGHGKKGLFDVLGRLGRSLQKLDTEGISKLLALLRRDDTLGGQIGLVTDQQLVDIFSGVPVDLVQPLLDIVEGVRIRHVVNDNDTVGTAVVRRSNGSETLLSSGIPNLQFDRLGVELNGADFLRIKRDGNAKSEKS
jgi:hypothetical protein